METTLQGQIYVGIVPTHIVVPLFGVEFDREPHGVFSITPPLRPNPTGLSVVRLLGIEGNILRISDVDMLDGTPLLDIKPYVDPFDVRKDVRIGWLKGRV